jgi:hypothetical protein
MWLAFAVGFVMGCRPRFEPVSMVVIDDKSLQPVAGGSITTVCMGLSPYATNVYVTDREGRARVMKYEPGASAVNIVAPGYLPSASVTLSNETIVRLAKRP